MANSERPKALNSILPKELDDLDDGWGSPDDEPTVFRSSLPPRAPAPGAPSLGDAQKTRAPALPADEFAKRLMADAEARSLAPQKQDDGHETRRDIPRARFSDFVAEAPPPPQMEQEPAAAGLDSNLPTQPPPAWFSHEHQRTTPRRPDVEAPTFTPSEPPTYVDLVGPDEKNSVAQSLEPDAGPAAAADAPVAERRASPGGEISPASRKISAQFAAVSPSVEEVEARRDAETAPNRPALKLPADSEPPISVAPTSRTSLQIDLQTQAPAAVSEPPQRDSSELELDAYGAEDDRITATEVAPFQSRRPPGPSQSPARDMNDRFAMGDFSGALRVAESLLQDDPSHADAQALAEKCREVLHDMYLSRLGSLRRIPQVVMAGDQIRWLSLDHKAGFMLSMMDGHLSIEELLDVCGMPELDALRILCKLQEEKVINLN